MGRTQFSPRARRALSMLFPVVAALWGSGWGCGGVYMDSGAGKDGGAGHPGTGGATGGDIPVPKPGPRCGNGVLDGDEQCDGQQFASGVDTCNSATMGQRPIGPLRCTKNCMLDLSNC